MKVKKNKLKSHSGINKVMKVRKSGTIKIGVSANNHNTGKQSSSQRREKRKGNSLSNSDYKRVKSILGK